MASKQTNAIEINSAAAGQTIGSGAVAAAFCSCHGHIQLANVVKHMFLILAQGRRRLGLFTMIRTDQKYYNYKRM
ncbi:unnamed protein product [Macrosiphum euphorbiae]|uniref:Uncharacterized protein n=1 Tax=Macrosiphum euphorbiae TaxID=13131 RepID=A0AAV0VQ84_9HEMI|nr:unnamed protein product [Macrosiphum euphorbiae]